VKIHAIYYWAAAFRDPVVERQPVPVRYDPFDAGTAYAFVGGRWVRCVSEHYARLAGHSEREVLLATQELHRRQQRHARQGAVTAHKLAAFLASVEAEEVVLAQRLRDGEAKAVFARMDVGPDVDVGPEAAQPDRVAEVKESERVTGPPRRRQARPEPVAPGAGASAPVATLEVYEAYR
jgi:hypothetical protein